MYNDYQRNQTLYQGNTKNERKQSMIMRQCLLCFQDIHKHQDFYHWLKCDTLMCGDCRSQWKRVDESYALDQMKVHVLYEYNDFLENLLFQYKEGLDVALRDLFFYEDQKMIEKKYHGYTMVLMPSAETKNKERGFYALQEMLQRINLAKIAPFYKSDNRKQTLLSYTQRQKISEYMHIKDNIKLPQAKLLLVDDVCTTGATLTCAYHLLQGVAKDIQALVLCANPLFLQKKDTDHKYTELIL